MKSVQDAAAVLISVSTLYSSIIIIWYIRRRNEFPMSMRVPIMAVFTLIHFMALSLVGMSVILADFNTPCFAYHWLHDVWILLGTCIPGGNRLMHTWFTRQMRKELEQTQITQAQDQNLLSPQYQSDHEDPLDSSTRRSPSISSNGNEPGWFTRHRQLIEDKMLVYSFIAQMAFFIILFCGLFKVVYPKVTWSTKVTDPECPFLAPFNLITMIPILGGMMFFSVVLRDLEEGLYLKFEYLASGSIGFIPMIVNLFPFAKSRPFELFAWHCVIIPNVTIIGLFPIYLTYRYNTMKNEVRKRSQRNLRLTQVIETPKGFKSFQQFLFREFSVENLFFWDEVRTLFSFIEHLPASDEDVEAQAINRDGLDCSSDPLIHTQNPLLKENSQSSQDHRPSLILPTFAALSSSHPDSPASETVSLATLNDPSSADNSSSSSSSAASSSSSSSPVESHRKVGVLDRAKSLLKVKFTSQRIFKRYLQENAPYLVNISYQTRANCSKIANELFSKDTVISGFPESEFLLKIDALFQPPFQEILQLMENDSYSRFVKTEEYATVQRERGE